VKLEFRESLGQKVFKGKLGSKESPELKEFRVKLEFRGSLAQKVFRVKLGSKE